MSPIAAFVLGLIAGWVIEWIIDWIYWRRRTAEMTRRLEAAEARLPKESDLKKSLQEKADLEGQLATMKANYATLQDKYTALEAEKAALQMPATASQIQEPVVAEAQQPQVADLKKSDSTEADLESQPASMEANYTSLQEKDTRLETENAALQMPAAASQIEEPVVPDDLIVIKGIGPVIAKKLNDAGIYTFRQLGELTPNGLRGIVGDVIQRLADEEDILDQARKLAAAKDQAANS